MSRNSFTQNHIFAFAETLSKDTESDISAMLLCVSDKCDSPAKKRSSPRSERRIQLAASTSKTSLSLKHSQRSLLTGTSSSSPSSSRQVTSSPSGRPARAKLAESQSAEKSAEMKNEDSSASASADVKINRSVNCLHYICNNRKLLAKFLVTFWQQPMPSLNHPPLCNI